LGEIKARKGDLQGGLRDCNTAISREQSASNYISLSDVQNQIGDYYYGFTDSVNIAPRFLDSVKAARNYYIQALQSAEQAIAQDKFAGSAYFVRANCRIRLLENRAKPTSEVFEDIKKAEELMPSNAYVRMVHALYLFKLGAKEDLLNAEKLMVDVLEKKPFIQNGYPFLIQIYDALMLEGYDRKKEKEAANAILTKRI
jgi:predicted Zn-dependent protease